MYKISNFILKDKLDGGSGKSISETLSRVFTNEIKIIAKQNRKKNAILHTILFPQSEKTKKYINKIEKVLGMPISEILSIFEMKTTKEFKLSHFPSRTEKEISLSETNFFIYILYLRVCLKLKVEEILERINSKKNLTSTLWTT